MSQQSQEIDMLDPQEAALVRNLRRIAPNERAHFLPLSEMYVELFPLRPTLRLVSAAKAETSRGEL